MVVEQFTRELDSFAGIHQVDFPVGITRTLPERGGHVVIDNRRTDVSFFRGHDNHAVGCLGSV